MNVEDEAMSSCEAAIRWLHRIHDGEAVAADERAALESHVAVCPACAAARGELAGLGRLLAASLPEACPPARRARFAAALAGERARERYWLDVSRHARGLLRVAAAVALATGIGAVAVVGSTPPGRGAAPEASDEAQAVAETFFDADASLSAEVLAEVALGGSERLGGER